MNAVPNLDNAIFDEAANCDLLRRYGYRRFERILLGHVSLESIQNLMPHIDRYVADHISIV